MVDEDGVSLLAHQPTTNNSHLHSSAAVQPHGGLINTGPAVLVNTTFSNNTASIFSNGMMMVSDSISNSTGGCVIPESSYILSVGYNLVNSAGCQSWFMADGDLRGVDPRLGPIHQNVPGHTPTHALLPGSPAIDAGLFVGVVTDQRGVPRPQGEEVDIGAYEYRPVWDAPARVFLPTISK